MTEELTVIVCFRGMVSLIRSGKSVNPNAKNGTDFKLTKSKGRWIFANANDPETTLNIPNEDRDIQMLTKRADQIVRFSPEIQNMWLDKYPLHTMKEEDRNKKIREVLSYQIEMHASELARAASSGSRPLDYQWYIQVVRPDVVTPVAKAKEEKPVVAKAKPTIIQETISHVDQPKETPVKQVKFNKIVINVIGHIGDGRF